MIKHVLSISGGKDSDALYALALEMGIDFLPVCADTGNEHPWTLEHLQALPKMTGGPEVIMVKADFSADIDRKRRYIASPAATRVRYKSGNRVRGWNNRRRREALEHLHPTGNPFLDLCMMKGRFPSTRARFCSRELKHAPIYEQVQEPLMAAGHMVYSWQGVRSAESQGRRRMREIEHVGGRLTIYRPILGWSVQQVFAIARRHGITPNPLYTQGAARVGCFPCIHSGKEDLRNIADRFPEHIARIAEWEDMVGQCGKRFGIGAFFAADRIPGADKRLPIPGIHGVVQHSRTARGGRQYDLFAQAGLEQEACSSLYGLCE